MLPLNHSPIDDMEDMPVAVLAGLGFTRAILLGEFDRGRIRGRQALHDQKVSSRMPALVFAELNVRIHSPPAKSQRTFSPSNRREGPGRRARSGAAGPCPSRPARVRRGPPCPAPRSQGRPGFRCTSTMCRRRIAKCASLIGFMACPTLIWSWFARPGSRDVLTQETERSPQLGPLTAGHICMRGDFAPPPVVGDVDERPDECARGVANANGGTKSGSRCQDEWPLSVR